jgi:hypothetical protein
MAVKEPGFDNSAGSRNRRLNRYASADGNNADVRHKFLQGTGLAFVSPDQVTDTGSELAQFEVGEFVRAEGSTAQDGEYEIATVVAGQLDMVEQTITAEGAGPSILITSLNNRVDSRLV